MRKDTEGSPDRVDPRVTRTRAKVLTAANELLRELGFAEVTIEDISARSGVSRSTMYRHWSTREEILRDAFSAVALSSELEPVEDLREDLLLYTRAFGDGLQNVWGRAAATLAVTALDDVSQREVVATFTQGYAADVSVLLARAASRGEVPHGLDPEHVADSLVAPLFHRYLFKHLPLDQPFIEDQVDRVHRSIVLQASAEES